MTLFLTQPGRHPLSTIRPAYIHIVIYTQYIVFCNIYCTRAILNIMLLDIEACRSGAASSFSRATERATHTHTRQREFRFELFQWPPRLHTFPSSPALLQYKNLRMIMPSGRIKKYAEDCFCCVSTSRSRGCRGRSLCYTPSDCPIRSHASRAATPDKICCDPIAERSPDTTGRSFQQRSI